MARKFHRPRTSHPIAELNVTNLIDLGFMLLIIFMIVANPALQDVEKMQVDLPVASASTQKPTTDKDRTEAITVKPDGTVMLGEAKLSLKQLSVRLAAFAKEPKPPIIELRLDKNATAQQFISVMDELKKNNLTRLALPTQLAK